MVVVRAEAKRDGPSAVRPKRRRASGVADDGKPRPRKPGGPMKTRTRGAAAAELAAKQPMFAERRNLAVWRSTSALPSVPPSYGPVSNIPPGPGFGGRLLIEGLAISVDTIRTTYFRNDEIVYPDLADYLDSCRNGVRTVLSLFEAERGRRRFLATVLRLSASPARRRRRCRRREASRPQADQGSNLSNRRAHGQRPPPPGTLRGPDIHR